MGEIRFKKIISMTGIAWIFFVSSFLLALFYLLPRYDVFGTQDQQLRYFSTYLLIHAGPQHIPFADLTRPGFLLNIPILVLGGNYYSMGVVYVFLASLSGFVFYQGWFARSNSRSNSRSWILPICLNLGLFIGAGVNTWILDYYSVPMMFLFFAFGFYAWGKPFLSLLAGLSFGIAAMGNLAMMPGVFLMGLLLAGLYWRRWTGLYLVCFILFILFFLWGFLLHWGILDRLISQSWVNIGNGRENLIKDQVVLLIFLLVFSFSLVLGVMVLLILSKGLKSIFFECLFWLSFIGLLIGNLILCFINIYFLSGFLFLIFFALLMITLTYVWIFQNKLLSPKILFGKYLALGLIFLGIEILNRVISRGSFMFTIYEGLFLVWLLSLWIEAGLLEKKYRERLFFLGIFIFSLVMFKNLIVPSYSENGHWMHPDWISQNDTYSPAWQTKIPKQDAAIFSNFFERYQQYHCDQKGLLAYDQLVPIYILVHRIPPYDLAWMDAGLVFPVNRYGTGEYSLDYLKNQKNGWCVVYRQGSGFNTLEKPMHRDLIFSYITQNANSVDYLGHFLIQKNKIFLFVK